MQNEDFVDGLLDFVKRSPTPFHAVQSMVELLEHAGFQRLTEKEQWAVNHQQGRYFVTRNDSSIIAFRLNRPLVEHGIHMVGAHTDSPCLKVKPNPEITTGRYLQLGVEVYGGALLNPWFDRDLSLAGRVSYLNEHKQIEHRLIDWQKAIAVIPSLAIHLDREANDNHAINKQLHLPPVLMRLPDTDKTVSFHALLLAMVNGEVDASGHGVQAVEILDYELSFYDVQDPAVVGLEDDFIASARLDNLLSCYTGIMALLDQEGEQNALLVCNDHEEVGSVSAAGAQGNFLKSVLSRLSDNDEALTRTMASSVMISVDNAHAVHPNFVDKHEPNHGPLINAGPVIKTNANQRYATNSETAALFKQWCAQADVPVQSFVVRSDMGCGSTIGPITANELGVRTVDVGVPTFAMHSIRELAGRLDAYYLYQVLLHYFH
ncbi:MAG: M18 family aminopeptidase [Zetaproteobacteria bacterium CG12_big_fil_rev_8_21_14_0_65_54_13]|nr:MAG: M18 family aminopeptidase [Zetaproteobacteria bacterium CG12_big_fil_rev_8_21_14_0_65_54_13]PIX53347.1 MAG: M18 family aminopeptidase [Zetaproteobacteria bacterium CG_4_10_14_3_um_filter_54_28]PJA30611.1 MAG: M18 family aminopeptidase [Zetaproteobacteria bacterium CG_4_9_14_3_um_filter_54_145]